MVHGRPSMMLERDHPDSADSDTISLRDDRPACQASRSRSAPSSSAVASERLAWQGTEGPLPHVQAWSFVAMSTSDPATGEPPGHAPGAILLVGAGKMGGALLHGWVASGLDPAQLAVIEPQPGSELDALMSRG